VTEARGASSGAFEPPLVDREPWMYSWILVIGAWALAGAAVGTAAGITAQWVRGIAAAGAVAGIGGIFVGGMFGAAALASERARSVYRPELTDARGARVRPLHGALLALPSGVAVPALLWLVVLGTVALRSWVPAATFGTGAFVVGWASVRAVARHRLTRALEALEQGRPEDAVGPLHQLASSWLAGRSVRGAAALNLAMLALNAGNAEETLRWASQVRVGAGRAWAATTRALALLLRGDPPEDAEEALAEAARAPAARAVQPESDAVRILVVWRREGEAPARRLAEGLYGPAATALHRALLARLRERTGEADGARELRTAEVQALLGGGLGGAIAELR
jgi:hypothetical protein